MNQLRFDEQAVIVTGAGRGIGRAYALLLAERGARVVVNDLGTAVDGDGADDGPAAAVVAEIEAAGGEAIASTDDVSTTAGAEALVQAAIDAFGSLHALVNNAGIIRWAGLPEADLDNIERHLAVHVAGSFNTARAAWPHLVAQQHGRVVMTTSAGVFGLPTNLGYATAKGGILGLTRSLAAAGARSGIAVNAIAPAAGTRMGGAGDPTMAPDAVAPMAAYLAHEDCPVNGEVLIAGAGRFARLLLATTDGYVHRGGEPTIEDVASNWSTITDARTTHVPTDLIDWSRIHLAHIERG